MANNNEQMALGFAPGTVQEELEGLVDSIIEKNKSEEKEKE